MRNTKIMTLSCYGTLQIDFSWKWLQSFISFRECLCRRRLRGGSTSRHPVLWADMSRQCDPWFVALRNHKNPFMHVSPTWALACAETVHQCPGIVWQVEARLLDSRVTYKMTVDHSSRQPVFFPLRSLIDRSCVCPDRASSYKSFLQVVKHIGIQRPVWVGLDVTKQFVCGWPMT